MLTRAKKTSTFKILCLFFPLKEEGSFLWRVRLIFDNPSTSILSKIISIIILFLILLSVIAFILETLPSLQVTQNETVSMVLANGTVTQVTRLGAPAPPSIFFSIETVCIYIFTVEYVVRLLLLCTMPIHQRLPSFDPDTLAVENLDDEKPRSMVSIYFWWVLDLMNLIDFVAILPYWIEVASAESEALDLQFVRILRIVRVFRVFKMGKYHSGLKLFVNVMKRSTEALSILLFIIGLCTIFFGSLVYLAEHGEFDYATRRWTRISVNGIDRETTPYDSIPSAMWWVIVTATTVGYGDLYPTSHFGRAIAFFCVLIGVVSLALPISIIGLMFEDEFNKMQSQHANKSRKRSLLLANGKEENRITQDNSAPKVHVGIGFMKSSLRKEGYSSSKSNNIYNAALLNALKKHIDTKLEKMEERLLNAILKNQKEEEEEKVKVEETKSDNPDTQEEVGQRGEEGLSSKDVHID